MTRIVKTCRWSPEEWAEIERAAGVMAPTSWVREAALAAARRGGVVSVGAPAAQVLDGGPVAAGPFGLPAPVVPDLMAELKASLDRVPPAESAGSASAAASLPAAGRPSGAEPSPSSGSAPGRALVEVVAAGLAERFGPRADHAAAARRMVVTGRVSVDGVVVSDPGARISGGEDLVVS